MTTARRVTVTVLLAGLGAFGAVVAAQPASAGVGSAPDCTIALHDHTPGVYPGGLHLHQDCV